MTAQQPPPRPLALRPIFAALAALLVVVGSLGPWVRVLFFEVSGTDTDGVITLILGLIAGALLLVRIARPDERRWLLVIIAPCFLVSAAIGICDWVNLERVPDTGEENPLQISVQIGWGLVVMTISAMVGSLLALSLILRPPVGDLRPPPSQSPQPAREIRRRTNQFSRHH